MWKTLVCLVTAMTGTAMFLGWLAPPASHHRSSVTRDEIVQLADAAVWASTRSTTTPWSGVEIGVAPPDVGAALLTATTHGGDAHFCVDVEGRVAPGDWWLDPRAGRAARDTLRIEVARRANSDPITDAQWTAIRAIVTAVGQAGGALDHLPPVRLGEEWEVVYGLEPGSLFELTPLSAASG